MINSIRIDKEKTISQNFFNNGIKQEIIDKIEIIRTKKDTQNNSMANLILYNEYITAVDKLIQLNLIEENNKSLFFDIIHSFFIKEYNIFSFFDLTEKEIKNTKKLKFLVIKDVTTKVIVPIIPEIIEVYWYEIKNGNIHFIRKNGSLIMETKQLSYFKEIKENNNIIFIQDDLDIDYYLVYHNSKTKLYHLIKKYSNNKTTKEIVTEIYKSINIKEYDISRKNAKELRDLINNKEKTIELIKRIDKNE